MEMTLSGNYKLISLSFLMSLLFSIFFSCTTRDIPKQTYQLKDSLVKNYLDYTSKLKYFDTLDYNYRFLKAFYLNDTIFLKEEDKANRMTARLRKDEASSDSITKHPELTSMKLEEGYQFSYSKSFCDLISNFTIIKERDTITLYSATYQLNQDFAITKAIKVSQIKLSIDNWGKFNRLIKYADFWGMKTYKETTGFDGDFLVVHAIERNKFDHIITKRHEVRRQFVSNTSLFEVYVFLAKLARYEQGCLL